MFVVITSLVLAWVMWYVLTTYIKLRKMPPGPFPLPLLGNILQVGTDPPFTLERLRKQYGNIYTVTFPIGTFVVVNSGDLAHEVYVTKKDDFEHRNGQSMGLHVDVFHGKDVFFSDFSPEYSFRRKIMVSALHTFGEGLNLAELRVNNEIQDLLNRIESTNGRPFCIQKQFSATMTSLISEWLFSKRYDFGDPDQKLFGELDEKFITLFKQTSYQQIIPFLKYLPNNFVRKLLEDILKIRDEFLLPQLKEHHETYEEGLIRDITDALLAAFKKEKSKDHGKDIGTYEDLKYVIINIIVGSIGTSGAVLSWFIVYMILHEDIQSKVQQEVHRVVGRDRLPCWKDAENLPYVNAVLAETIRHSAFQPMTPRCAIRDSSIKGYHIPKGTDILINNLSIQFNPTDWEQPTLFKPERFLDHDGKFVGWNSSQSFYPFGGGRRICPGQVLGKISIFCTASRLIHQFRFETPKGETKPTLDGTFTLLRNPKNSIVSARLLV